MLRKEGGRRLASIQDNVEAYIYWLEDYIYKSGEKLITAIKNNKNNTMISRKEIKRKEKCEGKQVYGHFKQQTNEISHEKTWTGLRKGNLKKGKESLLIAAQNNTKRTNYSKARIDKTLQNSKCRLCGNRDETINNIISECSKLVQKECKKRHNCVGSIRLDTTRWGRWSTGNCTRNWNLTTRINSIWTPGLRPWE